MASAAELLHPSPGDVIGGKYRVESLLGRGGMGVVLAARHQVTGKKVALKWILNRESDALRERFVREARAAGRIHHPNVVDVYDVIEHDDTTCLVMELLSGEPLSSYLAREHVLGPVDAARVAIGIARGLDAAHQEGVIHRDLKPANVFLTEGTSASGVRLLDFGISKILDPTDAAPVTQSGAVLGTPHYMAPEQVVGMPADPRADLYALGAVLYEMLSGRPPHHHEKVTALLVEIATSDAPPIGQLVPELPSGLGELVMSALMRKPTDRPSSVAVFGRALEAYAGGTRFDVQTAHPKGGQTPAPTPSEAPTELGKARRRALENEVTEASQPGGAVAAPNALRAPTTEAAAPTLPATGAPQAEAPPRTATLVLGAIVLAGLVGAGIATWAGSDGSDPPAEATLAPAPSPPPSPAPTAPAPAPRDEAVDELEPAPVAAPGPETAATDAVETEPAARRGRRPAGAPTASAESPDDPSLEPPPPASTPAEPSAEVAAPEPEAPASPPSTETPPRETPRAGRIGLDDF